MLEHLLGEGEREHRHVVGQAVAKLAAEQIALIERPDGGTTLLGAAGHGVTVAAASADGDELFGDVGEDLTSGLGDQAQVLDAHPDLPRDIDAGLDGHDVAGRERLL